MIKNLLFTALFILGGIAANAQTTGTDFNVNDCSGNNHHLFGELNSGYVVVIAWVMPCFSCIQDPVTAYNIVQQSAESDQILFYLVDDYANTSCGSLESWATEYGFDNAIIASDSDISMSDYGVDGMPKIVILSGSEHEVFFNENSSTQGFVGALTDALNSTSIDESLEFDFSMSVYPNPSQENIEFSYVLTAQDKVSIELYNVLGEKLTIIAEEQDSFIGKHTEKMSTSNLSNGVYLINLNVGSVTESIRFTVSK